MSDSQGAAFGKPEKQIEYEEAIRAAIEKILEKLLRRTQIPRDAKNPTKDLVVITGEECAKVIDYKISEVNIRINGVRD